MSFFLLSTFAIAPTKADHHRRPFESLKSYRPLEKLSKYFVSQKPVRKPLIERVKEKKPLVKKSRQLIYNAMHNEKCYWLAPKSFLYYLTLQEDDTSLIYDVAPVLAEYSAAIGKKQFSAYRWKPLHDGGITDADIARVKPTTFLNAFKNPTALYAGVAFCPADWLDSHVGLCLTLRCPDNVIRKIARAMRKLNEYSLIESTNVYRESFQQVYRNWEFHLDTTELVLSFVDFQNRKFKLINYRDEVSRLFCKLEITGRVDVDKVVIYEIIPGNNLINLKTVDDFYAPLLNTTNVYAKNKKMEDSLISAVNIFWVSRNEKKMPRHWKRKRTKKTRKKG